MLYIMKYVLSLCFIFTLFGCKYIASDETTSSEKTSRLIQLFKASETNYPKISVHRGGKGLKKYPENCLETLQFINDSITAIFEIDVAKTKDGQLILMHDNTLNRTTTGIGLVRAKTYKQLLNYNLIDDYGNTTSFKIPLFTDVLNWCKANNVILTIDIKRSVKQEDIIAAIKKAGAEDISIFITYDVAQAKSAYKLAPNLLLSVSTRNHTELDRLLTTDIPTENMLAFTGTRLSDATLYERLKQLNSVKGDYLYKYWQNLGVPMLATDRPFAAYHAIH